jgi:DNA-binding MarR family transcriptional regulator
MNEEVQGVVRRLIERGLIARSPDPSGRRASILTPSREGLALARRAVAAARAIIAATLEPLEQRQFLSLLVKLV